MSLYILVGGMVTVILGAGWLWWRSYLSGRKTERLDALSKGLNGLDRAMDARNGLRDPDRVERLRDKYRTR